MISKYSIQRIMEEARVEEVVGEYVALKKRGANYLGVCPFHNEKTPSFNVSPAKNIYKCFGCGKAGNSVTFLMEYAQLSYVDALRQLAKKYNVEIEETNEEKTKEEIEQQSLTESIFIANGFAQKYFTNFLLNEEAGGIGLAYFKERGFDLATIEKFQLGFAPDGKDIFARHALANAFQKDILVKAGLVADHDYGMRDFFRNRVMFPIHSINGKVQGFGGRILKKDEKSPKYINTSENEVYQKSKILYGAFFAKQAVRKYDECFLVEGYTDVISLHRAGIENTMASSGTSLTTDQIRMVKRMTQNITMLYDGDAAGIKAALRGTDMILEEGMNVRIVLLPEPEDPDSYVKKVGGEGFLKYIAENKKDVILFKTSLFAKEAANDPIKKSELIREILVSIAKIPDPIQRAVYCKECSQHFDMPEQLVTVEVNKLRRKLANETSEIPQPIITTKEHEEIEKIHSQQVHSFPETQKILEEGIIRLFLEYGDWAIKEEDGSETNITIFLLEELDGIEIEAPHLQAITKLIKEEAEQNNYHNSIFYTSHQNDEIRISALNITAEKYQVSDNWWTKHKIVVPEKKHLFIRDIESTLIRLKQFYNLKQLRIIEAQILECQKQDNSELLMELMSKHIELSKQRKEFAKLLGTIVYRPNT
ncbi:MAG TPA: DNA primase [Chitinophagales bacterium]|nr:DNA primase [Chitinophagales bacterium]HRP39622.1 DNA primase [Chitinophagales bacterium]